MTDKTHDALVKAPVKINVELIRPEPIQNTPTSILSIDGLFSGGMPQCRVIEMYGDNNTGKSTTALLIARQYIRAGKRVAILDAEGTFDMEYAEKFGMDVYAVDPQGVPLLQIFRTSTAEQWMDALFDMLESKLYGLIVIDTLAKFVPRVEFESSIEKGTMGVMPRLASRQFRRIGPLMQNSPTTLLILNQERLDIGNANIYTGAPKTSPGGKALKHEASIILHTLKPQDKRVGDQVVGLIFRFKVEKSKLWTPDVKAVHELHIQVDDENGIYEVDYSFELFLTAKNLGLLFDKSGLPWQKNNAFFEGENLGNGQDQIIKFLDEPSDVRDRLEAKIYELIEKGQAHGSENQGGTDSDDPEAVHDGSESDGQDEGAERTAEFD